MSLLACFGKVLCFALKIDAVLKFPDDFHSLAIWPNASSSSFLPNLRLPRTNPASQHRAVSRYRAGDSTVTASAQLEEKNVVWVTCVVHADAPNCRTRAVGKAELKQPLFLVILDLGGLLIQTWCIYCNDFCMSSLKGNEAISF